MFATNTCCIRYQRSCITVIIYIESLRFFSLVFDFRTLLYAVCTVYDSIFRKSIFYSEDNRYFFNQDATVETAVLFYHIESIVDNVIIDCWSGPELDVWKNHQKCQLQHLLTLMPFQSSMILKKIFLPWNIKRRFFLILRSLIHSVHIPWFIIFWNPC